jgi:Zn-finger nucleic acid-binding protein
MNCTNCAAPLPQRTNRCSYCGTLNDTDLRSVGGGVRTGTIERDCPRCEVPLHALALKTDGGLEVDRCDECLGIFFDPKELEHLLDGSAGDKREIDLARLETLIEEEAPADPELRYLPCPECRRLMNRKNYA